jgi:hypothetical protein
MALQKLNSLQLAPLLSMLFDSQPPQSTPHERIAPLQSLHV